MPSSNQIARVTSAMGEPVRLNMLMAMRFEGGLTASELAGVGNVAPSTASEHLARLMAANLIVRQKRGRQRLYSLAEAEICDLLDALVAIAERARDGAPGEMNIPEGLLHSRLCYDHLAGRLGCDVTHALFENGLFAHGREGPAVTGAGAEWLRNFGVDPDAYKDGPRCPLRLCHDWTEDDFHLGGGLASDLLTAFRQRDWMRTTRGDARVFVTPKGISGLRDRLGLDLRRGWNGTG